MRFIAFPRPCFFFFFEYIATTFANLTSRAPFRLLLGCFCSCVTHNLFKAVGLTLQDVVICPTTGHSAILCKLQITVCRIVNTKPNYSIELKVHNKMVTIEMRQASK